MTCLVHDFPNRGLKLSLLLKFDGNMWLGIEGIGGGHEPLWRELLLWL